MTHSKEDIHIQHSSRQVESAQDIMSRICGEHNLDTHQRSALNFQYSGMRFPSKNLAIGNVSYGTSVGIHITNLRSYSISLPTLGQQHLQLRGKQIHSNMHTGLIVSNAEQQDLFIDKDCRKLQVAIPEQSLEATLAGMLNRSLREPIVFDPEMHVNSEPLIGAWWKHIRAFLQMKSHYASFGGLPMLTEDYENFLLKALLMSQQNNYSQTLLELNSQHIPKHILAVKNHITSNPQEDICADDLQRLAGVSKSKLYDEFKLHYGTSPMSYLRKYRLQQIHKILSSPQVHSKVSISQLAYQWGFTHLSRFADEYKQEFGEKPSETKSKYA